MEAARNKPLHSVVHTEKCGVVKTRSNQVQLSHQKLGNERQVLSRATPHHVEAVLFPIQAKGPATLTAWDLVGLDVLY